jgi:hypothetical protein
MTAAYGGCKNVSEAWTRGVLHVGGEPGVDAVANAVPAARREV